MKLLSVYLGSLAKRVSAVASDGKEKLLLGTKEECGSSRDRLQFATHDSIELNMEKLLTYCTLRTYP